MPFRNDGEGLHRSRRPGRRPHYVYGMSLPRRGAHDLRLLRPAGPQGAVHVPRHRADGLDRASATRPADQVEPGRWELATTQPLSTYFVTVVAGPYHVLEQEHDGIPLGLSSRQSLAGHLDERRRRAVHRDPAVLRRVPPAVRRSATRSATTTRRSCRSSTPARWRTPGCVTFRDPLVFTSRVDPRASASPRASGRRARDGAPVVRQPRHPGVVGRPLAQRVVRRVHGQPGHRRRHRVRRRTGRRRLRRASWGLVADRRPRTHPVAGNGAVDAAAALQDFDGISYAKGSRILEQLDAWLGDDVFFGGVRRPLRPAPLRQRDDARPVREPGRTPARAT